MQYIPLLRLELNTGFVRVIDHTHIIRLVLQFSVNEDLQLEITCQVVFFCSNLGVTEGLVFRVSDVLEHDEESSLLGDNQVGFCGFEGQLPFTYDGRTALYQRSHSGVVETRLDRS